MADNYPINPDNNEPAGPNEVEELTLEDTGIWLVHTAHSIHRLDLNQKTSQRIPGEDAARYDLGADVLKLRSITHCSVGSPAYFTYRTDEPLLDYKWALTTPVVRIVREVLR